MKNLWFFTVVIVLALVSIKFTQASPYFAQNTPSTSVQGGAQNSPAVAPGNVQDMQLANSIRQQLYDDAGLSSAARNIQILTVGGNVILRGTVNNRDEHEKILSIAQGASGNVTDEITVK